MYVYICMYLVFISILGEAVPIATSRILVQTETDSENTGKMEIARIWQWIRQKKLLKEGKLKIYEDSKFSDG